MRRSGRIAGDRGVCSIVRTARLFGGRQLRNIVKGERSAEPYGIEFELLYLRQRQPAVSWKVAD